MSVVYYKNQAYTLEDNETVLEGLLKAGHDIPNACRAGACQSCKMKVEDGAPPATSQQGLSGAEKELGYFLSCICKTSIDLKITDGNPAERHKTKVLVHERLNEKVLRLKLEPTFEFKAGQFFTVLFDNTTARSYSIASTPEQGFIECHIKLIETGLFSPFAFNSLKTGDTLTLQGPMGTCVYSPPSPEQPLILASIGTGLAPIYGILKEAIKQKHSGPIHLVSGAKAGSDLYLVKELNELAAQYDNVTVDFVCQENPTEYSQEADIYQFIKSAHPSTKGYGVYLCGAQSFVNKLKKQCFLAGANMPDIHADAFLPCT